MHKYQFKKLGWGVVVAGISLAISGCAPKFLVSNQYLGDSKVAKFMLQPAGQATKGKPQFNLYGRICDLDKNTGKSIKCQDTMLLNSVETGALYKK